MARHRRPAVFRGADLDRCMVHTEGGYPADGTGWSRHDAGRDHPSHECMDVLGLVSTGPGGVVILPDAESINAPDRLAAGTSPDHRGRGAPIFPAGPPHKAWP